MEDDGVPVKFDLVVHGICFADLIYSEIPHLPEPGEEVFCGDFGFSGGGAFITAVAAARLGLKVAIVAPFGSGALEQVLKRWLDDEGVDTTWTYDVPEPRPYVTVAMNHGGDRGFLTYVSSEDEDRLMEHSLGVFDRLVPRWVHLGARPGGLALARRIKALGGQLSLDVGWNPSWLRDPELLEIVQCADLFLPNRSEAQLMTNTSTIEAAVERLSLYTGRVVVTDGERGGAFKDEVHPLRRFEADPAPIKDTTGAGDNFTAGVLAGLIHGVDLDQAVKLGSFCGRESVQALGGSTNSPTWMQANAYLRSYGWQLTPWRDRGD
ncbi:MAG: hypothetical protein C7B45_12130 [Sulfobacillus acidophilus]|uniref:Carbohydrate kinase PfkB domain-containing protein n=1 Tax=Sulfobacillus acidophilus TaxID=53633 RepID=A0A2T2WFU6_9FIRM|nr:MAG: hypothetical protein C7B45_12130 [Sulfobacillus acidophilus]